MNHLTALLDLCMDDKTAQSTQKARNTDTGQMSHVFENSTRPKGNKPKLSQVITAGSQADTEK